MTLDDIFAPAKRMVETPAVADAELSEWVAEANWALQRLQAAVGREPRDAARIAFPRGYLREIGRWRLALPFVRNNLVRNSVSDTLMMHDVQAWS
jgi:hypothetical protein